MLPAGLNDTIHLSSIPQPTRYLKTLLWDRTRNAAARMMHRVKKDYDQTIFMFRQIHAILKNH